MFLRNIYSWICVVFLILGSILHIAATEAILSTANADHVSVLSTADNADNIEEIGRDENVKGIRQSRNPPRDETVCGKHIALLISVNEYYQVNGLPTLLYCDNDMDGLATELESFDFETVRMSESANSSLHVNRTNVKEQLKQILDKLMEEDDVLLIAYSGHGVQEGESRYLCPPNTPREYEIGDLIPLYVEKGSSDRSYGILNIIEDHSTFKGTCFVLIDACRNGSSPNITETIFPSTGKFHIFSSCGSGEVSYEENGFGRFMHCVISAFNVADGDELSYGQLAGRVVRQMSDISKTSKKVQTPTRYETTYEQAGSLILGRKKKKDYSIVPLLTVHQSTPRGAPSSDGERYTVKRPTLPVDLLLASRWPDFSQKDQEEQNVITDIIQLPGLNGEWWFQEMPWYIPHVRLALAYVLADYTTSEGMVRRSSKEFFEKNIYAYLNTNTYEARELLWRYFNTEECQSFLSAIGMGADSVVKLRKGISGRSHSREAMYDELKNILEQMRKKGNVNCIDLYTFAVLEHQMTLLSDGEYRKINTERAKQSYKKALEILGAESENPAALLFYQLCLSDYIRLLSSTEGNTETYMQTVRELTESLKRSPKDSLFQIAFFTENANNESKFGQLREANRSFREADSRIVESRIANTGHPLVANYHEKFGWYRIDYWRLPQAKENFETALLIRQYNAWSSSNPVDKMYVTYGLHAMGTIALFAGNNERAREHFEDALDAIKKIRNNISSDGLSLMQSRLNERETSTLERLADLTLYGESESSDIQRTKAVNKALDDYGRGASMTNETATTKTRLIAKRVLLLLQKSESSKFDEAREYLKESVVAVEQSLENPSANTVIPLLFFKAASIAIDLCEAVEKKNEGQFVEARKKMREFLERFHFFSRDPDGLKRDVMELRMYCAAMLVDADWAFGYNDFANADSTYLALCLYILSEKEGIHAYLRPYYERQLRWRTSQAENEVQQESIRSIAMNIQRMRNISVLNDADVSVRQTISESLTQSRGRMVPSADTDDDTASDEQDEKTVENKIFSPTRNPLVDSVTLVVFYFPGDTEQKGMALIIPSNGREVERIVLDMTREQLHIEAQTGMLKSSLNAVWKRIKEESDIVSPFLSEEKGMRQSVVISWSDESCWSRDSRKRITKDMFPYKTEELPANVTVQ
ncbi:MAG: caspase family protein [Planctomycetaceae bacterium]|jgi:tetratricopeptide (TPR) repeat protein|nr:caspase family protein [Planctomycetaceae bacterium]